MNSLGKILVVAGLLLVGIGSLLVFFGRIPFLGRLPGDVYVEKKNVTFFFPITTSLLISSILSLIMWLWPRR